MKFSATILTAALLLSLVLCTTTRADSPAESAPARKARAASVLDVFERRCADCHDQAKHGSKKGGFGFVLDLAKLRADPQYVNLSAPATSQIYSRLSADDGRMPRLTKAEKERGRSEPEPMSDADTSAILEWLTSGAPANDGAVIWVKNNPPPLELPADQPASSVPPAALPVAQRQVVREAEAMGDLYRDLLAQPEADRRQIRYVSILPQHNNTVEISDEQLQVVRSGVRKLLNSLSSNPRIALPAEVGPGKAFYRFKLDDLGWTEALWERIASCTPYALEDSSLGRSAGTAIPVLRADWLAAHGTQPPLYHEILRLPATLDALQMQLGLDVNANLRKYDALRAGFTGSGISRFNRLVERHELRNRAGYFWVSYDFAGDDEWRSLLQFPLGPPSAHLAGGRRAFRHDGGEIIFNLPNGFQAYYLTNGTGHRLDVAPSAIVGDTAGVTGRPDVVNGLSCIICHSSGMKEQPGNQDSVTDMVRAVAGRGGFSATEEEAILQLYKEQKQIDAAISTDRAAFKTALEKAGVVPGVTEPISALTLPFDERMTLARAAAELGLTAAELDDKLKGRDGFGVLQIALGQRALPRASFSGQFADLVRRLGIGRSHTVSAQFAGSVAGLPAPPDRKEPHPLLFRIETDRSVYRKGDPVEIRVFSETEGHLRLYYKDAAGKVSTLFPTAQLEREAAQRGVPLNDLIPGGRTVTVSGKGSITHVTVYIEGPRFGHEQLGAVMTGFPLDDNAGFRADLENSPSIEMAVSRTISMATRSAGARLNRPDPQPVAAGRGRIGLQILNLKTLPR